MTAITLLVGLIFCGLALRAKPGAALALVIVCTLIWPEYLRIPMGPIQMSAPRLVALMLIMRFIIGGRHRKLQLGKIDAFVTCGWLWIIIASTFAGAEFSGIAEQIGRGLDTVLMFFAARLAIQSADDFQSMLLPLIFISVIMCVAGAVEATTDYSPYNKLVSYGSQAWFVKEDEYRLGLLRAKASTGIHIYFGLSMALVVGFLWALRFGRKNKTLAKIAAIFAVIAALSSMSSGPWMGLFAFIFFSIYANRTKFIKPSLWLVLCAAIFLELASNRHFYNLVDYLSLSSETAWYRTRLLEVAVSQIQDFWLVGVGGDFPNHWGALIDGRLHVDIVNHFLIVGVYGGVLAMFFYIGSHVIAIKRSIRAWRMTLDPAQKGRLFSLAAILLALDFTSMSVGLFGPPLIFSNILLGTLVGVSTIPSKNSPLKRNQTSAAR
ncbi:MAG: hypothetical protein V7784_24100 [Oceanospirillaceae bacterium]